MSASMPTNPGTSENLAKTVSLADAIAKNLTAGREAAEKQASEPEAPRPPEQQQPERQPEPQAAQPVPEPKPEPAAPETQAEQETDPGTTQDSDETPERYTLADFAHAADLEVEALLDRFDVEVIGEDGPTSATLKDVMNGYRWNAANTQRAQELAAERKQVETKLAAIDEDHRKLSAILGAQFDDVTEAEKALEQQYQAIDWNALRAKGDGSYADAEAQFSRARHELKQRKDRLANSWTEAQKQAQELAERQQADALPKAKEELFRRIPEWRDEDRARKESEQITRFVSDTFGVSPEAQSQVMDPGVVHAMRELWRLKRQAEDAPIAAKKVKTAPKALKASPKAAPQDARAETRRKLSARLKRSGKSQDLAALILETRR